MPFGVWLIKQNRILTKQYVAEYKILKAENAGEVRQIETRLRRLDGTRHVCTNESVQRIYNGKTMGKRPQREGLDNAGKTTLNDIWLSSELPKHYMQMAQNRKL